MYVCVFVVVVLVIHTCSSALVGEVGGDSVRLGMF